jgi:REP element-mobilizing transposase RayT/DNA-binding response OmpR family regulator
MAKNILVVTPQASFGSMLRSSLEETGNYHVFVAGDEPTALVQLKSEGCELAFLDVDLGVDAAVEIGSALRTIKPEVSLIIVSDEDLPPALDALRPWTLLHKPFYLPELFEMLGPASTQTAGPLFSLPQKLPPEVPSKTFSAESADLPWLQDVNKAAQRLTRLTLESSAQAALITRGKKLWAYAGGLSQETADELVQIITRNWDEQKGGDLLRFARLETTRAEHMLYATTLGKSAILALVFDAETPFSTIRSQANSLAHSLAVEKTAPMAPLAAETSSKVESPAPLPVDESNADPPPISAIIFDIPSPIPTPVAAPLPLHPARVEKPVEAIPIDPIPVVEKKRVDRSILETRPSTPLAETHVISRESSPPVRLSDLSLAETRKHEIEELEVTAPSKAKPRPSTPVRPPQPGELDETRPHSITEVAGRVVLEPASPSLYHLNYACLLVPRFSSHYLTGDLAERLGEWLPHICIAFGWRLEFTALRPEYMQWVVSVPPNTSPGYLMRIMRQQTSEKIFADFPRLKKENPSGDFWAPGYLIMGGVQPHPQQLVKDYIKQTRKRQGDSQPHK